jgi:hypothetical protein
MKHIRIFLLIGISILPLFSLFHSGLPVTHDGQDHVARIANFYASLSEGNIVPRWASNLNWGFGHPILMFLYPLPSYWTSFIHIFGFGFVDSFKLVLASSYLLSIVFFYVWAKQQWNENAGFLGALLYGFAPYRFVDLYVRGALGEHVAFTFIPLIFLGFYLGAKKKTGWSTFVTLLGLTGLILSHNAISLMILPVSFLYVMYLWFFETKKSRIYLIDSIVLVICSMLLSAFFWIPAFQEGKYTLRDIVTGTDILNRFVPIGQFLYMPWSYGGTDQLSKEVGLVQWVSIFCSIFLFSFIKDKKRKLLWLGAIAIFIVSLFLMTDFSKQLWVNISIIQKFQFPWRFLSVVVVCSAIIGSSFVALVPKRSVLFICTILSFLILISTYHMWYPVEYKVLPEDFFTGIYNSTTDTGESSPIWSTRFMEHRPNAHAEVIDGTAYISEGRRLTTSHAYVVTAKTQARLVENTVYFPGWVVLVDGRSVPIQFQDPSERGLITFNVSSGSHTIDVLLQNTKVRKISNMISLIGIAMGSLLLLKKRSWG